MFSHSPLLQAIHNNASLYPDKFAVIVGENKVSYYQLYLNLLKAASLLESFGIKQGNCIVLSAHKDIEFIYLYLAAQTIGAINVIVDSETNLDRISYIENAVQPTFCFGYKSSKFPSKLFQELDINFYPCYKELDDKKGLTSESISEILFTTGTTGKPKGVCLTYNNIFSAATNINGFVQNSKEDIEVLGLPICHSFGMGRLRCNLIIGATIVILGSFANVRAFFKSIEQYHATGFGVVPAAWAYIRKISGRRIEKFANQIRYIEIGSASMPISTKHELLEMFPRTRICMHYGLTEASRACFMEFHDEEHLLSIGRPVCDKVDIRVFDDQGNMVPSGIKGELCIKGNMVMKHYLNDDDNSAAFHRDYFRTGDCGFMDEKGYLYLLGRDKELINVGGKKVSPMEVEDAICSLGVGDCVCVAMKDEKGIMGELVKCYVLKGSTGLSFRDISRMLIGKLEAYKRPVEYEWIDEIPQTSSGKKQRILLK